MTTSLPPSSADTPATIADPHESYKSPTTFASPTAAELDGPPTSNGDVAVASDTLLPMLNYTTRPPIHLKPRSVSGPADGRNQMSSVRSNPAQIHPVQLPSRGLVKDIANRFDRATTRNDTPLTVTTNRLRQTRGVASQRSPVSVSSGESRPSTAKLQKRRPTQNKTPRKSPATTSFGSMASQSSASTVHTTRSQPDAARSPRRSKSPQKPTQFTTPRPLFGEITADGMWNGNFDLGNYGPLPSFAKAPRRGSEGSLMKPHTRSRSHQDIPISLLRPPMQQTLAHKRSRSEMTQPHTMPSMPNLSPYNDLNSSYPLRTPPDSPRHASKISRIPVRNGRHTPDSNSASASSRPASASSNVTPRSRLNKSPVRRSPAKGKENSTTPRKRYDPHYMSAAQTANQTLSAKIVAPAAKLSPPLRSSRPRQPVSAATTSASRARAAERYHNPNPRPSRPSASEVWLGKPYDPQAERSKRKIPELDKINFEERRARIQRAISKSLKSTASQELAETTRNESRSTSWSSRAASRNASRNASREPPAKSEEVSTSEPPAANHGQSQAERELLVRVAASSAENGQTSGLTLTTKGLAGGHTSGPPTGQTGMTWFEESPVLPPAEALPSSAGAADTPTLLTPATYRAPPKLRSDPLPSGDQAFPGLPTPSLLDNVLRMREQSPSTRSGEGTEFADDSPSVLDSLDASQDGRWMIGNGSEANQGSIEIMLESDPSFSGSEPWSHDAGYQEHPQAIQDPLHIDDDSQRSFEAEGAHPLLDNTDATPRKRPARNDTPKPTIVSTDGTHDAAPSDARISQVLEHYQSTGTLTQDMLEEMQHYMVDLHRLSANGGSDAGMIQSLLSSVVNSQPSTANEKGFLSADAYEMPINTPDTPALDGGFGHVIVYGSDSADAGEEDDFDAKIRKADEEWERQQRDEEDPFVATPDDEQAPTPPPKDFGYTPRSSVGPGTPLPDLANSAPGLRISTFGQLDMAAIQAAGDRVSMSTSGKPSPQMGLEAAEEAPVPPPKGRPPIPDRVTSAPAISERCSSELSPYAKSQWGPSGSSRPSIDSQLVPLTLPGSHSINSFTDSTRQTSFDTAAESQVKVTSTPSNGPEHKRLLRRRHIIKELLDTENSYHQDLKIIEDIYKATCTTELVAAEDKKTLFGNCDEVERFALFFYDEMRKAATQVYTPAKQNRWTNKRGSFSTTQSEANTQNSITEAPDDEKDRTSTIGRTFLENLPKMEQVYGAYLRNHDAANQRLSAIQATATVKCWLDECHANASDITAAWDLDSLLVKPTQRVAKYPMLLQQLLETTPADHPDHADLKTAAKDSISMLTRINDAKKRADLVEQIINGRRGKDQDIRSGLAKAFGRRTEKLKERVGMAEAFQDPEFDELAHKFGGHYIRLQICMRDVQDYVSRTEKAVELINNYAGALELFTDVAPSTLPEIESKWRRYGQVIRELTQISAAEHKASVQRRVLDPMLACIKLHQGPQNAISKRKKRIVDYAKCKSDERRGIKPDKKTIELSDLYVALNDQLKIELPRLYSLTAQLVQKCLHCFLDEQLVWQDTWQRKLKPLLEAADVPSSIQQIEPAFSPDYAEVKKRCAALSICNGALVQEAANLLSPQTTLVDPASESSSRHRPSTSDRTLSATSETFRANSRRQSGGRRHSGVYLPVVPARSFDSQTLEARMRSSSSASQSQRPAYHPGSTSSSNRPWSHSTSSARRPSTANPQNSPEQSSFFSSLTQDQSPRSTSDRPTSDAAYFTPQPGGGLPETARFSGLFHSALPPDVSATSTNETSTQPPAQPDELKVMFVCASLFEFSIEQTRREGGYPYLQYVQGEVFDVVGQKGELWLARNQDDVNSTLGWIWEQHFIIVGQEE
ncbi:unnamed protein product [Zymoseptoria tritici ST99CH_1A5]|nr:unnamed protein product [Zymoseptoria tritici ST99CH_1E4]SMR57827.1 unnamed protein product [Zymoseptoria tritici ST99CH_3D1]SMY26262.1 unnamed protein product [Zymoseptoria tritici ST99CH_1A5]